MRDYDLVAIEDLKVKEMVRSAKGTLDNQGRNVRQKAGLNRSIHSQALSLLRKRLEDKAAKATSLVLVIAVNPRLTSQTCPQCESIAAENRKSQTDFSCAACGHEANADIDPLCQGS